MYILSKKIERLFATSLYHIHLHLTFLSFPIGTCRLFLFALPIDELYYDRKGTVKWNIIKRPNCKIVAGTCWVFYAMVWLLWSNCWGKKPHWKLLRYLTSLTITDHYGATGAWALISNLQASSQSATYYMLFKLILPSNQSNYDLVTGSAVLTKLVNWMSVVQTLGRSLRQTLNKTLRAISLLTGHLQVFFWGIILFPVSKILDVAAYTENNE